MSNLRATGSQPNRSPRLTICPRGSPGQPSSESDTTTSNTADDFDFFLDLLSDYEAYVYTTFPVIGKCSVQESIHKARDDAAHMAFCFAYTAVTSAVVADKSRFQHSRTTAALTSRALQSRPILMDRSQVDLRRIVLSIFVRIAFASLQNRSMELFYHGEAIVLLQLGRLELPSDAAASQDDGMAWLRLHLALLIYERMAAVVRPSCPGQPISLSKRGWLPCNPST